jgi:hypothetical protein
MSLRKEEIIMGKKADFIYDMANEDQPKPMVKAFKDALSLKGIKYDPKTDDLEKLTKDAVFAFFDNYPQYDLTDPDKESIAQSRRLILASMPTPRY